MSLPPPPPPPRRRLRHIGDLSPSPAAGRRGDDEHSGGRGGRGGHGQGHRRRTDMTSIAAAACRKGSTGPYFTAIPDINPKHSDERISNANGFVVPSSPPFSCGEAVNFKLSPANLLKQTICLASTRPSFPPRLLPGQSEEELKSLLEQCRLACRYTSMFCFDFRQVMPVPRTNWLEPGLTRSAFLLAI